jgi:hypothetical protein
MIHKVIIAVFACALIESPTSAQSRTVKLNGGLEAEVLALGRSANHQNLSVSMRISNKGTSSAYLLLVGTPVVTDNTGGGFRNNWTVSGLAHCVNRNPGSPDSLCFAVPKVIDGITIPLQAFTLIDPDISITVNFLFENGVSQGPLISFSANLAYRLVNDTAKDATLTESDKYKQFRIMTLSFPSLSVTDAK